MTRILYKAGRDGGKVFGLGGVTDIWQSSRVFSLVAAAALGGMLPIWT